MTQQDANERVAELRVVEGVEERVDGRVKVAEPQHEQVQMRVDADRLAEERSGRKEREVGYPAEGEGDHDGCECHHRLRVAHRVLLLQPRPGTVDGVAVEFHADPRHLVDLLHLLLRDAQYLHVDDAHDDERTEVGAERDQQHVRLVGGEVARAAAADARVLHAQVGRVPAEVDRHEAHQGGEEPDGGDHLPGDARRHPLLVAQRKRNGEVAVEADGEQRDDRDGAERHVERDVDVAEGAAERPVGAQRRHGA